MLGLVLTAGGARGAYQAGILKRLGEIRAFRKSPSPFAVISGASAGAINGTMLAANAGNFREATRHLAELWGQLEVHQVFYSDSLSLAATGLRWLRDLSVGALFGGGGTQSLLDASPLRELLSRHLALEGIAGSIRRGHLYAVAISATSYHSGKSFTFIQGRAGHPVWAKSRRVVLPVDLTLDHVLASAAIPIIFQPVHIRAEHGECYFGDGGLRLVTPLSPAIRLGASRIFAVGIRCQSSANQLSRAEPKSGNGADHEADPAALQRPPLSQICGVFLNAIFLDHLDTDIDHLLRMNELIAAHGHHQTPGDVSEPMRIIQPFVVSPSEDLAMVAAEHGHRMPRPVRFLLDGLGTPNAQSADLMSYLLFDKAYTRALIDIGYRDAARKADEIEAFLMGEMPRGELSAAQAESASRITH